MPDYKNFPVQRGLSDEPLYRTNPRKYALRRCDLSSSTVDKAIQYLGSIIQIYLPEDMTVSVVLPEALALAEYANEHKILMDVLLDYVSEGKMEVGNLGKFAGYIAICALCIQSLTDISDIIRTLKRNI